MGVGLDRTARGVVIYHGIAGAFLGAVPAAIMCMMMEKPFGNPWFRDVLLYGSLGGGFIGALSAMAGMLHEDLRSLRRQRMSTVTEPHMEKAMLPSQPRIPEDFHAVPVRPRENEHALASNPADALQR